MKHSTSYIVDRFPNIDSMLKGESSQDELSTLEQTMYNLCLYFEQPEKHGFDLKQLYTLGDGEWIAFTLEAIRIFFDKDTYLMAEPSMPSIIRETESPTYFNQTEFANYLNDQGIPYTQNKLAVYRQRGKIPKEDLTLSGNPYWLKETVTHYTAKIKRP